MRITWWGHATTGIELAGLTVLTDPVLTDRVAFLRRYGPTPPPRASQADVVVVSHLHGDHLHLPSLRRLPAGARLIVPRGAAALLAGVRDRVEEVGPGDVLELGGAGLRLRAVHAEHDDRRHPWSRHTGTAMGFVLSHGGRSVWFAGDTGLFDSMASLGPVDTAVIPVGGWGPTLGPHHLDPEQAAEAVRRVGARDAIPIHYGTLWPRGFRPLAPALFRSRCRAPGQRFAAALAARGGTGDVASAHVLAQGESVELDA
ncbi:MAG TPA: MBL fold metallo-hydrolase [Jatrophihabitans sp.]|nr:MBL fold metallo-hydrolase [Jatrophihabitans sp.]